ncbi:MAG: glycosyltransferase family 2 protein [Plesiomonas sp.]|uniref:glycosyltransferase family 2 protein n=1 Tax=Plesiomonas sp. TaxID=2486279 RepID=UPI003F3EC59D
MKISIIIPVFNGFKYYQSLKNTLEKIDLDDRFEIIVIDDGSVDHFNKILRMEFPKVKFFYQKNQGSGIARNLGIKHSTGDWLMFMDVDDVINMSELNKALNTLDYNTDIFCFPAKRVTHSAQGVIETKWKPDIFKVDFSGPSFLSPTIIIDSINH